MNLSEAAAAVASRWKHFAETVAPPAACIFCGGGGVTYDGWRRRTASVLVDGEVVYLPEVLCRLVRCARSACGRGWTLRPSGLSARRHYQLDVVAQAMSRYLFDPDASQERIAAEHDGSRRTVGRWVAWLAGIVLPAALAARVAEAAGVPVRLAEPPVASLERKARTEARRALLKSAAWVLVLLEALGQAQALEPPGLQGVLENVQGGRDRVTTYRAPAILELARRTRAGLGEH